MKKHYFLLCLIACVTIFSCKKSSNIDETPAPGSVIIYNNNSPSLSKNPLTDHLVLVEKMSLTNTDFKALQATDKWKEIAKKYNSFYSDSILRYNYNNSKIQVIEIPIKVNDKMRPQSIIIYSLNNNFLYTEYSRIISNSKESVTLKSLSGTIYFKLDIVNGNKISNAFIGEDIPFKKVFNGQTHKIDMPSSTSMASRESAATCPETTSSFSSCFQCAVNECANDTLCTLACGFYPASCVVGFTIACIE